MTTLNVNGSTVEIDADPTTPILWALRDHLDLTGTKFGATRSVRPCRAAWVKHDVPQCGYCQSGQIMSAVALSAPASSA